MSIGKFVRNLIAENNDITTEDVLAKVQAQYPEAKTSAACVAWYKSDMRKKGLLGGGRTSRKEAQLAAVKAELEFLKDKAKIKAKIEELEAKLKELEPAEEAVAA